MARYYCTTIEEYMALLKHDIKEALDGRVEGEAAGKEDCTKMILSTFDEVVYHLFDALASANAIDKVVTDNKVEMNVEKFNEYNKIMCEEKAKYGKYYKYEGGDDDE